MLLCSQRIINLAPGHMATAGSIRPCHCTGPDCHLLDEFNLHLHIQKNEKEQLLPEGLDLEFEQTNKNKTSECSGHVVKRTATQWKLFSNDAISLHFLMQYSHSVLTVVGSTERDRWKMQICSIKHRSLDQIRNLKKDSCETQNV